MKDSVLQASHWGAFHARKTSSGLEIMPHAGDRAPSVQLRNLENALDHPSRILRPAVRESWLEHGPGPRPRPIGEGFVEVSWEKAAELLAAELQRVKAAHGPSGIYGGSYGWASAGRFHHAQSQIHRFLTIAAGGYVNGVSSYSAGAASPLLPRIFASFPELSRNTLSWDDVVEETEVLLVFGGMPLRNSAIGNGGVSDHLEHDAMQRIAARKGVFHLVSPMRDDLPDDISAQWHAIRPGSDTALILALCYVLQEEGLADEGFLASHCTGYEIFRAYLISDEDGGPKTPEWAEALTGIPAATIRTIARELTAKKSLIVMAHALQRAEYGEQPVWAAVSLAAMLGQIGLPGRGFSYSFGSLAHTGRLAVEVPIPVLPQDRNPCPDYIPVAMIAEMLLNPGAPFSFMGEARTFPEIHLLWWAGGNPFHHHQDLHRLSQAIARVDTFVVQDQVWTATAKSADIVLPISFTLERDDFGATRHDARLFAMQKLCDPVGEALSDHEALVHVARAMGPDIAQAFTEGRSVGEWLRHLYEPTREALAARGHPAPDFDAFWAAGTLDLPARPRGKGQVARFRAEPETAPLSTPSGKIELFSPQIAALGYDDAPGHAVWRPHQRAPDTARPFHLIANAPATRLHSQLDFGPASQDMKVAGREQLRLHPKDAAKLGVAEGDLLRVENEIGACLVGARLTEAIRPCTVHLQTGAWFDPQPDPEGIAPVFCAHGNANVLLPDKGTSRLTHGCTGQLGRVAIRKWQGTVPEIRTFDPPPLRPHPET